MQKTEQKLYVTPFTPAYWRDAAAQLFNVRILCITAILIALRVAIKSVYIPVGPELNVTFGFFVNALGASIFGPVVAIIAAAITDTLGCIIAPQGTYFFPFIFVEIAGSLVFALFLWRAKMSATRVILSRFFVSVVCNFIMNPLIMIWYYAWLGNGQNYAFITLPRVVKNLALFPFEAFLLVIFMGVMIPILAKLKLIPKEQVKPVLTKGHIALLAALLVVAVIIVVMFYTMWMPTQPQSTSTTLSDIKVTLKSDRELYKLSALNSDAPMTVTVTVECYRYNRRLKRTIAPGCCLYFCPSVSRTWLHRFYRIHIAVCQPRSPRRTQDQRADAFVRCRLWSGARAGHSLWRHARSVFRRRKKRFSGSQRHLPGSIDYLYPHLLQAPAA